ncbi:PepSY domain-containing protein [Roseomonas frigidaquae]|uniref:PepSY domain-containing protein n=1 Tax=Falsiroseomonas frigidaquae TaxID=487318 RepID=A0ABX1F156_9PROT|nr:PepSY domain-containing protein [Falsiroseomonas frigidaquae]
MPGSRQPAGTAETRPGAVTPGAPATGTTTPVTPAQGAGAAAPSLAPQGAARTDAAPLSGANSFTEGQAQSRIADAGYADVTGLRLDEQGIWRGRAIRNGRPTGVALDYQGNIVATD